jgi:hypothetical protein
VVEPVTPAGEVTEVACEEDACRQVSLTDRQPKVSYGQMNHENLEKVTCNKAQVKTVTYLGASIFLINGARSLLAG